MSDLDGYTAQEAQEAWRDYFSAPTEGEIQSLLDQLEPSGPWPWEDESDYSADSEIERLKGRLELLKERREEAEKVIETIISRQIQTEKLINARIAANHENWEARRRAWAIETLKTSSNGLASEEPLG